MKKIFKEIWKEALPYQDKRNDKGHAKTVLNYALEFIKVENVDENIVVPAAILHDIGWSQLSKKEIAIIFKIHGEAERKIRIKHEEKGRKLAEKILTEMNYSPESLTKILEIISGHDTREGFLNKNDGLVRDADKLWRYSKIGFWVDVKRLDNSAAQQYKRRKAYIDQPCYFYSESARKKAREEIEKRKKEILDKNL